MCASLRPFKNCLQIVSSVNIKVVISLVPTWQYFGTITCDGLQGIMKLYIDKP